jgi:hypothetical protein
MKDTGRPSAFSAVPEEEEEEEEEQEEVQPLAVLAVQWE